jgi:hypothetical protein
MIYIFYAPQATGREILKLSDAGIWISSAQNPEKEIQVMGTGLTK